MISYSDFASTIDTFEAGYANNINEKDFFGFPIQPVLDAETRLLAKDTSSIAYFSMEYGIAPSIYNSFRLQGPMDERNKFFQHEVFSNYWLCDYVFRLQIDKLLDIPIYGGGLGVLAGDTMKSCADLGLSVVGLGVLWNKGYFKQNFWYKHGQVPEELAWAPETYPGLIRLKNKVTLATKEGPLHLRLWKYYVYSHDKTKSCPIILLDSNVEENPPNFKQLTDQLYRSDHPWWKIFQRLILGIGGMKALESLGYTIDCCHLNEGHAAFALLEGKGKNFVYTCHTPVAAGHDRFAIPDLKNVMDDDYAKAAVTLGKEEGGSNNLINLTTMCLKNCSRVNAVALKHGEIMRLQFPQFSDKIQSITNGVHLHTWVSESFKELFDKYKKTFGDWRQDPSGLANVKELAGDEGFRKDLFLAHQRNKKNLIDVVKNWRVKDDVFTLGWARRITGYKRPALIFHQIDKIIKLAYDVGPIQIIMAGKAHPNDDIGGAHIDEILDHIDQLNAHRDVIKVLILENYDTYFGKLLSNSVDVWLNNPLPPFEASGTSGMKAILNGVLQLSTLDGWVVEAAEADVGWIFGYQHKGKEIGNESELRLDEDSTALCQALEKVTRLYYETYDKGNLNVKSLWIDKMVHCIGQASFFNTQRMVEEYRQKMWNAEVRQKLGIKD